MNEKNDALAVRTTAGSLTVFDEEMARLAKSAAEAEKIIAGQFLSVRGGRFALAGESLGNEVEVVILGSAFEYDYYPGPYNPDDTSPPTCYALSFDEEKLAPHAEAADPQNTVCVSCPHNAWNSAGQGRKGKRCQNRRRLALIAAKDAPNAAKAEVIYMRLPVTSVRLWSLYVKGLAGVASRPPFAVITRLRVEPHAKHQFEIKFEYVSGLSPQEVGEVMKRVKGQMDRDLLFPYPKPSPKAAAATPRQEKF